MKTKEELCALLQGEQALNALLHSSEELARAIPEIRATVGFDQKSPWHCYDVWEHTCHAVAAASSDDPLIRLVLLFHDLGKPVCFSQDSTGRGHFYGHARVGMLIAQKRLDALGFDESARDAVAQLIYLHLENLETDKVERFLFRLGETQLKRLIAVQYADNLAHHPDAIPARLERLDRFVRALDCQSSKA